jgi:SAM-dependent methyltransferase
VQQLLREILVCPRDRAGLAQEENWLTCEHGHRYPVIDDVPVMLLDDVDQTAWWAEASVKEAREQADVGTRKQESASPHEVVDPWVQDIVAATSGYLYKPLVGKLREYPIPEIRLPPGSGGLLLDIGCNWGRWCASAARRGYRAVGIDPSLSAVLAAKRVLSSLGLPATLVVGDGRYLPFRAEVFDIVFSYSVIQHFSKEDAKSTLAAARRVLAPEGFTMIQMPNRFGLRSLYHLARRGFSEGEEFDVRYWTVRELEQTFTDLIGPTQFEVDGFFGLGIQPSDRHLLPSHYRAVVDASEALRRLSSRAPVLRYLADSVYVISRRSSAHGAARTQYSD